MHGLGKGRYVLPRHPSRDLCSLLIETGSRKDLLDETVSTQIGVRFRLPETDDIPYSGPVAEDDEHTATDLKRRQRSWHKIIERLVKHPGGYVENDLSCLHETYQDETMPVG